MPALRKGSGRLFAASSRVFVSPAETFGQQRHRQRIQTDAFGFGPRGQPLMQRPRRPHAPLAGRMGWFRWCAPQLPQGGKGRVQGLATIFNRRLDRSAVPNCARQIGEFAEITAAILFR